MTRYPIAISASLAVIVFGYILNFVITRILDRGKQSGAERYRRRGFASTLIFIVVVVTVGAIWARLLPQKGTFFGLIGAGLAIALREPLLAIAGRIAIFVGHMYSLGDRIEISNMSGDVIDVGLIYTRMLEIGSWVKSDQATGRIIQFSNSIIFANPVFNYTQNFSYLWDEIVLPITYNSNVQVATKVLLEAANQYTREFLNTAEEQLEKMRHNFLVPRVELKPAVYVQVTDNYVTLTPRYIVDPKKRRAAKSFLFTRVLEMLQTRRDVSIGSATMDLTLHQAQSRESDVEEGAA